MEHQPQDLHKQTLELVLTGDYAPNIPDRARVEVLISTWLASLEEDDLADICRLVGWVLACGQA